MDKLIVFARAPRLGQVKTRMAATMGEAAACEAYREMLRGLFENLAKVKGAEAAVAPADAEGELREFVPSGWRVRPQAEGPLEARLVEAFRNAFAEGAQRVAIIGSDCPEITGTHIRGAFKALREADAVFGPATDGGYWLAGLKAPRAELFEGIPWSTPEVLGSTLARAKSLGLKIDLLEILADIDTEQDWRDYQRRRKAAP